MNDTKAIRISSVKYLDGFRLRLRWVNGTVTSVDLREPVHRLKGLRSLRDESVFAAIVWSGPAILIWEQTDFGKWPWNSRAAKTPWNSFVGVGATA